VEGVALQLPFWGEWSLKIPVPSTESSFILDKASQSSSEGAKERVSNQSVSAIRNPTLLLVSWTPFI